MDATTLDDGKVIPLGGARRDLRATVAAEVLGYWEALRAGRQVPLRSEVDPRGIERALEYAFVLERVGPSISRFRLAGMHCTDLMGMEVRGMPATTFFTPAWRQKFAQILEGVFDGPEMADLTLVSEGGYGRPELRARMIILPLKSDFGDITRALGCLVSDGPIGRAPRRFDLLEARILKVVAGQPLAMPAARPIPEVLPELGEAPAPFQHAGAPETPPRPEPPKTRGAHLRLVKSDG